MNKFLPISAKMKMADLVHLDYRLISVLGRFGIAFGFGNNNISKVCKEYGIDTGFFLAIVNSYHNHKYFPEDDLINFDSSFLIDYLKKSHNYFLECKLPEIQQYIDEIESVSGEHSENSIKLLNNFFKEYKQELILHFKDEEQNVFSLLLQSDKEGVNEDIYEASANSFSGEHPQLETKLSDLKNLIIKFLPHGFNSELSRKLLFEIFLLESDLDKHSRIEERVIAPKIEKLKTQKNG
ncbi:MAG: hemerythrin domain-containing protein [Bacteroidales bacterium]